MKYLSYVFILVLGLPCYGAIYPDTEEYVPIPELTTQKPVDDESVFDDVRLHGDISFLNSYQDIQIAQGIRERGGLKGFALGFGVDLFSQHWIAEGVLVNFPESQLGDARVSSNGFELRLLYDAAIYEGVTLHGGVGVASRNYNVKTANRPDNSVKAGENSFASGATVLVGGIQYWPNAQISAGLELSNHMPLATGDDPSSVDLAIKLGGHF